MATVSQAYSIQAYSSIQNKPTFSGDRSALSQSHDAPPSSSTHNTNDTLSLSEKGKSLSQKSSTNVAENANDTQTDGKKTPHNQPLTQNDLKIITNLQKRDAEVRAHEQAHLSAAGQHASGGASFSYTTGPDGKRYVNAGSVPIDLSKEKTPEATIQKMRTVRRAALAPANPSGADRNVAAQASAKETQAMSELQAETEMKLSGSTSSAEKNSKETEKNAPNTPEPKDAPKTTSHVSRKLMASAYQDIAAMVP